MANRQPQEEGSSAQTDEPQLNVENIQGNIIPGFNKDFQALLFLEIEDEKKDDFRRWLETLIPRITPMKPVLIFRSFLKEEEWQGKPPAASPHIKTTWINIAFSHSALEKLGAIKPNADFKDKAFTCETGMRGRSENLGDPKDPAAEGNPKNWVVGGLNNEADVILIVASDDRGDLFDEVTRIENSLYEPLKEDKEKSGQGGAHMIFQQYGATLSGGREHFGFRDGVSQPGVRGWIEKDPDNYLPGSYLTPRQYSSHESRELGQDLVWPGEFVFGRKYPRQDPNEKSEYKGWNSLDHQPDDVKHGILKPVAPAAPEWAEDGSFLVFRRLRQNVGAFHQFLHDTATDPNFLGAKCVGRWPSGTPVLHAPAQDKTQAELAQDNLINNDFTFKDEDNVVCPFAAHIRKAYPRDGKSETQTHRLLRRGIPYGEPSWSSPTAPFSDTSDRGLLFLAYETSIENQFEFLQQQANNRDFKEKGSGYDPIIGQNEDETRERFFTVTFKDKKKHEQKCVSIKDEWVIPTGGGYFFAPSIKALLMLASTVVKTRDNYFYAPSPEALKKAFQNKGAPKPNGTRPGAITPEDWARIWTHAWLEPEFKKLLKRNPAAAVKEFQEFERRHYPRKLGQLKYSKPFDLMRDIYPVPFVEGQSFHTMSLNDLVEIAAKAKFHGNPFCVQPNAWEPLNRDKNLSQRVAKQNRATKPVKSSSKS